MQRHPPKKRRRRRANHWPRKSNQTKLLSNFIKPMLLALIWLFLLGNKTLLLFHYWVVRMNRHHRFRHDQYLFLTVLDSLRHRHHCHYHRCHQYHSRHSHGGNSIALSRTKRFSRTDRIVRFKVSSSKEPPTVLKIHHNQCIHHDPRHRLLQ